MTGLSAELEDVGADRADRDDMARTTRVARK